MLGWPAPAAGIVAVLAGLDRGGASAGRMPLLHSPAAALVWGAAGWAAAAAISPGEAAGTVVAMFSGLGTTLVLDYLSDGELYLWPRTASPAEWLSAYPPESVVGLDGETFVVPCGCGAVPRPWAAWSVLVSGSARTGEKAGRRAFDLFRRHRDLFLSAGGLLALLGAVILK